MVGQRQNSVVGKETRLRVSVWLVNGCVWGRATKGGADGGTKDEGQSGKKGAYSTFFFFGVMFQM